MLSCCKGKQKRLKQLKLWKQTNKQTNLIPTRKFLKICQYKFNTIFSSRVCELGTKRYSVNFCIIPKSTMWNPLWYNGTDDPDSESTPRIKVQIWITTRNWLIHPSVIPKFHPNPCLNCFIMLTIIIKSDPDPKFRPRDYNKNIIIILNTHAKDCTNLFTRSPVVSVKYKLGRKKISFPSFVDSSNNSFLI